MPLGSELSGKAISLLAMSVRDTDYIGWYRHGRTIGLLLTTVRPGSPRDGRDSVKRRLEDRFRGGLMLTNGDSLQTHLLEHDRLSASNGTDPLVPFSRSQGQVR